MKVLVTGGAGYVGSVLHIHLKEQGHTAIVYDPRIDPEQNPETLRPLYNDELPNLVPL